MQLLFQIIKKIHRKHFDKIEVYIQKIEKYAKENNIDFEIDFFNELYKSSVIYDAS